MADKLIVLVTGANQGIGYYAAQKLAAAGKYTVLVGSRDLKKGQSAIDSLVADKSVPVDKANLNALQIDLTDDASIYAAVETVEKKYGRLDILVNNAGIADMTSTAPKREQFHYIFNTNVFGTAECTDAFLPLLRKSTAEQGKRIIFVSSGMGSLAIAADPKSDYPGKMAPVYRSSKTAENMLAVHYGSLLAEEKFTVTTVCPGYCGTNLNGYSGPKSGSDGAKVVELSVGAKAEDIHMQFVNAEDGMGKHPW